MMSKRAHEVQGSELRTFAMGSRGLKTGQTHRCVYSEAGIQWGAVTSTMTVWNLSVIWCYTGRGVG